MERGSKLRKPAHDVHILYMLFGGWRLESPIGPLILDEIWYKASGWCHINPHPLNAHVKKQITN